MEKVALLIENGCDENLAILLRWKDLSEKDKQGLTLEQCQWVWGNTPDGSPEKAETWKMVKAKAKEILSKK